jgi:hypothetical protein
MAAHARPARALAGSPEHWSAESRRGDVAQLDIPADAERERRFEIFCTFVVRRRDEGDASHSLRILVDGAHEWSRRVKTHDGTDSLDLRFRRTVAVGKPLRITALGEVDGAVAVRLSITAEEDLG